MDATTETTALLEKTHDPALYGERWAHRLDIRWDQVCFRHAAAGSFRNPQTPGARRAWEGYEKTLARYEAERAQALAAYKRNGPALRTQRRATPPRMEEHTMHIITAESVLWNPALYMLFCPLALFITAALMFYQIVIRGVEPPEK